MNLELHILQSFAPSNLNRDDTGSPKDCEFGGVRRARVSSQCWKRAIRLAFQKEGLLGEERLAVRTRKIASMVAERLSGLGKDPEQAKAVADSALAWVGLNPGKNGDSQYLLFIPKIALDRFAQACFEHWEALSPTPEEGGKKPSKKAETGLPSEVKAALEQLFQASQAADLALFGRMIADRPKDNIVAASQVAHALSTHKVDLEFDFFTAVDDLQAEGDTGAAMMGTVEYNAACFYRYANLDLGQLQANLGGDRALARDGAAAFMQASLDAIPAGKQNSMAAQNPPSLVLAAVRGSGFWSLANAFLKPVRATGGHDLMTASIQALDSYWGQLSGMYGEPDNLWLGVSTLHPEALNGLAKRADVLPVPQLIEKALGQCSLARGA